MDGKHICEKSFYEMLLYILYFFLQIYVQVIVNYYCLNVDLVAKKRLQRVGSELGGLQQVFERVAPKGFYRNQEVTVDLANI